ncbi:F-box only protein 50, partial [Pteropus alecto]|uniref:F-box only protein 50 n=1 Tax=Pteropus alecto TaxID=9402 RepID=UPI000D532A80
LFFSPREPVRSPRLPPSASLCLVCFRLCLFVSASWRLCLLASHAASLSLRFYGVCLCLSLPLSLSLSLCLCSVSFSWRFSWSLISSRQKRHPPPGHCPFSPGLSQGSPWALTHSSPPGGSGLAGINIYEPAPPTGPTQRPLEALGNFHGWYIRTEKLPHDLSWTVKQQCVDLLAEGLWEELLDDQQPDITVMDWYEDSRLDMCVYELHVWLLAADRRTVIAQHHVAPRTSRRGPPSYWIQVSHVFRRYGPGVRFVHFLHKTKNRMEPGGLRRTRVTDSSVSVQFRE